MTDPSHAPSSHGPKDETTGPAFFVACVGVLLFGVIELPAPAEPQAGPHRAHPAEALDAPTGVVQETSVSVGSARKPNEAPGSADPAPSPPVPLDMGSGTHGEPLEAPRVTPDLLLEPDAPPKAAPKPAAPKPLEAKPVAKEPADENPGAPSPSANASPAAPKTVASPATSAKPAPTKPSEPSSSEPAGTAVVPSPPVKRTEPIPNAN